MRSDGRRPGRFQAIRSTSDAPSRKFSSAWLASGPRSSEATFLKSLSEPTLLTLPYVFGFWALDHQLPPPGDWRTWIVMGGRGAGKTRAGSEWVRSMVEGARPTDSGRVRRVALVGETHDQVREIMVFGESGILECSPPDRAPLWEASRRRLVWPNGATAQAFSAQDPESLRGPQFDAAWADELGKWRRAEETWDMLQFCLRLGRDPKACVTTTPRNTPLLKRLISVSSTVITTAPTLANRANLAPSFLTEILDRYADTRLGAQEIDGHLLDDVDGALWSTSQLADCRAASAPELRRIVVAVDPPVTGGPRADACGIVVAGASVDQERFVVIEDASVSGASPSGWAHAAIAAYERHGADRIVAEINQGGDLVESVLRQIDRTVPFRGVHATRGKVSRAEPVAALYEQGRVSHLGRFEALETQMSLMTVRGFQGEGSPDRVDALVWALSELMHVPRTPGVRSL